MNITRPPLTYYGGKWRLAPKIINLFPEHYVYVEPYGGAASVLLRKEPASVEVYNDVYDEVVHFYRMLKDRPDDLIEACILTPYSRSEFSYCKELDIHDVDPVERARIFFVKSWQDRRIGGLSGWTGWRRWRSGSHYPPDADVLYAVADRLKRVLIENSDAIDLIKFYDSERTLFYVDPPYIDHGDGYVEKMSLNQHKELHDILSCVKGYVLISGYRNKLYDRLYKHWTLETFKQTNMNNVYRIECVWMNFEWVD